MEYQIFVIDCHYAAFPLVPQRIPSLSEALLQHAMTIKPTEFYSASLVRSVELWSAHDSGLRSFLALSKEGNINA